ncbi:MAG: VanW family protein [Nonlabens sp.]
MIREKIPQNLKSGIHRLKNTISDFSKGYTFSYAKTRNIDRPTCKAFSVTQDLKSNEFKTHNISIAKSSIETIVILPNEIFSFWKVVGEPSEKRGFVKSRSLINGKTIESYGGGLCQLSGMIYLASIHCGLGVIERHNHSVDIYDESTRYMPLGGDAAVAYGYKDLKIRNNLESSICFEIIVNKHTVSLSILHTYKIKINDVKFIITHESDDIKVVDTMINNKIGSISTYKIGIPKKSPNMNKPTITSSIL